MRRIAASSSTTSTLTVSAATADTRRELCLRLVRYCSIAPMKIAVAMSGGVDSSTAAYILKSAGHDVVGLSMQMYDNLQNADSPYGGCCTIDDLADARRVARKLDIPHFTLNLEQNFHQKVITPFVQSYLSGMTPSPCVLCNTHVKFDLFHQKALAIGAEKIATGHYARITRSNGAFELRKARDPAKDQSYFLF